MYIFENHNIKESIVIVLFNLSNNFENGMPPKDTKKAKKVVDYAADEFFDPNRSMIHIEHTDECPIFNIKAVEFLNFLIERFPGRSFVLIKNKIPARPGAFEIHFSQTARTSEHCLWTGIKKGPPRKRKFPKSYELLVPEIEKILKKIYIVRKIVQEEDEEKADKNNDDVSETEES